ncbi:hypothetical protein [Kordiimonas aquimaris]|uniref:hypothetical protein n=1 Tax=Kordiimonas aquimaris TaxID=707591 RepID=UPI0021D12D5F|nr:hypothetical protein [Kordiimonas aquimaris]
MTRRLPDIFEDMRQALLGQKKDHSWTSSANDAYSATIGGLKEFSGDTLTKTATRFNEALPYIERAGYEVTEIEVGLGLSPKVVPHLRMRELISDEEQLALLAETKEKKLVNTILSSLFKASAARSKLKFKKFHFTDIELELSILPTVVLKFRPNMDAEISEMLSDQTNDTTALEK